MINGVIFSVITCISVFLTLMLSVFFLVTRRGFVSENKILALLLFVFNLQIIYSFMTSSYAYQYFMDWHKLIFLIRQTSFLIGPLIYFYVMASLKKEGTNRQSALHFLPFLGAIVFLAFFYRHTDRFVIWESPMDLYSTIILLIQNIFYLMLVLTSGKSVDLNFQDFFKKIRIASHYTWLQILLLGFIVVWVANLNSFAIYMIVQKPGWCAYTASIYGLVVFLFVNTIMLLLLLKPDIYYRVTKYKNNKLKEQDKTALLERLNAHMASTKPYLNPDISLELLANEISVSPRDLSQLINESFHKNFKSFILEYWIKESMQMLADSKYHKHTVLEILYEVGFNSKSAFNSQFKMLTNMTPLEYRAKYIN